MGNEKAQLFRLHKIMKILFLSNILLNCYLLFMYRTSFQRVNCCNEMNPSLKNIAVEGCYLHNLFFFENYQQVHTIILLGQHVYNDYTGTWNPKPTKSDPNNLT